MVSKNPRIYSLFGISHTRQPHTTYSLDLIINERERKIVLSVLLSIVYSFFYYKYKIEYIELGVIKVVLIRVIIEKNTYY